MKSGWVRRPVLLTLAFAALLVVMASASLAVWTNARAARERSSRLHRAHMEAGAALAAIRANVYLSAILTRDYLLDADPTHAQAYVDQFSSVRDRTERALEVLAGSGQDEEQRRAVERLRSELSRYWDPTEIVLDWSPAEKRAQRAEMLRERVKLRNEVFDLAGQVEQLISQNFDRERQKIASADRDFEASVGWTALLALILGIAIAIATLVRMFALERQSQLAESELRLLSGQLRTAQEEERKYLSRELHDQVGQMLTGVRMELAAIARLIADANGELSSRIARAKGTVEQSLRVVRNIAMLLRPSMLDDFGLSAALAWLVKEVSRSSGIEIKSEIDNAVDSLPDAHRTCIYRLVQEALTNAARHSGARCVEIVIRAGPDIVAGSITDDGRGFELTAQRPKGLGLVGMEERVRELGGTIQIVSSPGRGTRVELRLPRPKPPEGDGRTSNSPEQRAGTGTPNATGSVRTGRVG
jgi:two-component sensor histidine kinase